ncbi:hypothetical protein VTK26DRAFT_5966 [Humicola hyalothermophila]
MRRKEPENRGLWKLRWDQGEPTDRPVADISNWIRKDLASKYRLMRETELTFVKAETTAEDLLLLLEPLWTRAEDVPCRPQVCVFMHWALELKTLAADITIIHQKREKADPLAQTSGTIQSSVTFTVFMIPCQMLYLVTQIATAGIAANTFDPPFKSLDEVLQRPILEHTDCLQLYWKQDILDREIFPIGYYAF